MRSLTTAIVISVFLGIAFGHFFPSWAVQLGVVGKVLIQLIKIIASPLLFCAIVRSISESNIQLREGLKMLVIVACNATAALLIGIFLVNWIKPGRHLEWMASTAASGLAEKQTSMDFSHVVSSLVPTSILHPFYENNLLALVFAALLLGFGLRAYDGSGKKEAQALCDAGYGISEKILYWITRLAPIAVFGVMSKTIGENGVGALKGLSIYTTTILIALLLQVLIVYQSWIFFYCKRSLREFWSIVKEPVIYGSAINSSLATLPLTLKALRKMNVRDESAALGACVGTNLNNDGILLYEVAAALIVSQAYGIDLSVSAQISLAMISLVASAGMAGVPEAGFILLSVVLATAGLPSEGIVILLSIDWLIGRARSAVNILNDIVISAAIDGAKNPTG